MRFGSVSKNPSLTLTARDTFQIINFNSTSSQLGTEPVLATPENIQRGLTYLASLDGSGETEMIRGLQAALGFPHDEGRYRLVSFMTDGYIGDDADILHAVAQKVGDSRIFSFGVSQSPNRYLMDRMGSSEDCRPGCSGVTHARSGGRTSAYRSSDGS